MMAARAVCVHSLPQAQAALDCAASLRCAILLVSGPGAALYAGCGWWQALMEAAAEGRGQTWHHLLDCADAAGLAMAALRHGQRGLILSPTPALPAVQAIALGLGATLLTRRPDALDLAHPRAARDLPAWLQGSGSASQPAF